MCRWLLITSFQCRYISTILIVTIGIGKLVTICVVEIIMISKNPSVVVQRTIITHV